MALGTSTPDLDHGRGHQHVEVAGGERAHHRVLLVGRQPAVQHADPQPVQRALGEQRRHLGAPRAAAAAPSSAPAGAPRPRRLASPIRGHTTYAWWPGRDLLAQPPPGPVEERRLLRRRHDVRGDRRAAPAAARTAWRSPGRRRPSSPPCAGSASPSSPARAAAARPWRAARRAARRRTGAARRPRPGRGRRSRRPRTAARGCRRRCRRAAGRDLLQRPAPGRRAERAGDQRDPGAGRVAVQLAGAAQRPEQVGDAAAGAGRPAPRSAPAAPPARRRRPPGASPAAPPASCRSRPRPAAAGASGARAARSAAISSPTARWPSVSSYGRVASNAASRPASRRRSRSRRPRRRAVLALHERQLYGERLVPLQPAPGPGQLLPGRRAGGSRAAPAPSPIRLRLARTVAGSGSSGGGERVEHHPHAAGDRPGRHGRGGRVDRDQRAGELLDLGLARPRRRTSST